MKISVTFKDPDVVSDAIERAIENTIEPQEGLDNEAVAAIVESKKTDLEEALEKWISYGEYITIEFDTEAKTATVIPQKS